MYSTSEAAEKLGLSQDHVRLLARTGVIEAKKLGHDWVILSLDYNRQRRPKGEATARQTNDEIPIDSSTVAIEPSQLEEESRVTENKPIEISSEEDSSKGTLLVYDY